jgi:hypothetical protein
MRDGDYRVGWSLASIADEQKDDRLCGQFKTDQDEIRDTIDHIYSHDVVLLLLPTIHSVGV